MPRTSACNSEPAYKPGRCWAWVTVWLLLAGMLGVFGLSGAPSGVPTPVNQSSAQSTKRPLRAKPIENIQLGERLSGRNPLREDVDPALPDPDPATWRQVKLQMIKPSGKRAEIEFLWPPEYLEATGATVGGWVELDMPEVGAVGQAEVVSIGPCPPIPPGTGPIVTGRFVHQSDGPSLNIQVEGLAEPIGCTANHPFWSEDRQAFVEAGELQLGEHVRTWSAGVLPIACITPRPSAPLVYNLQVHGEHVYEVSELGVLVHNKRGVPGKVVPAPGAGPTLGQANPRSLLSRQGPLEMTPSRVQDMAEDMMVDRFNWRSSGPIVVAEGPNGVRIILDGHHRAAAAMEAGLDSVPIRIQQVPTDRWGQLIQEVFEAAEGRW